MAFQYDPPVTVYNGPDADYKVAAVFDSNDAATQLVGYDDRWLDAFGKLRTSSGVSLLEIGFQYDLAPLFVEPITATNGTVTHDADKSSAVLTVTADDGSSAAIQTYRYAPYERGRSQFTKQTFVMGAAVANVRRRAGYFDAENGCLIEQNGTTDVAIVKRSNTTGAVTNTRITQANWNIDTLDGTGPSGVTLDLSNGQIFCTDWQWLGTGRLRAGFDIGGRIIWVHEFLHANETATQPYTTTATLPLRWEMTNTAASAGATMYCVCGDVESEGGLSNPASYSFSAANTANVNTSTTRAALLAIRPAVDYPSGGPTNRQTIIPRSVTVISASADVLVDVFYNPTLTGGSWTRADASSGVEVNQTATISATGVPFDSFFVPAGSGQRSDEGRIALSSYYPITLDAAGINPRGLLIAATALSGTGTARASIDWSEVR